MRRKKSNFRIWLTTFLVVLLCISAAICVAVLVSCEKTEFDSSAPSPDYVSPDETSGILDRFEEDTSFEDSTLPDETSYIQTDTKEVTAPNDTDTDIVPSVSENDGSWELLLVNAWNPLPENFSVEFVELINGHKVDSRAYKDLQAMMDDCRAAGLSPYICSSYRTIDYQKGLHERQVNKYLSYGYSYDEAYAEASKWVAVPGTSEHHTGLALDIVASYYIVLDSSQEDMPEQQWLMENSYKYGWILRYPDNKTDITGIYYEPWHYRYVGKQAAKEIHDKGICLEEYLLQGGR